MTVKAVIKCAASPSGNLESEHEVADGCTAGELCRLKIRYEEKRSDYSFNGFKKLMMVNGSMVQPDDRLSEGDLMAIWMMSDGG